jgi:hypothetical protein
MNQFIVLFLLLILIISLVIYMFVYNQNKSNISNKNEILYYRDKSNLGAGYGMFAHKNIKKGDIIERCTYLSYDKRAFKLIFDDYCWNFKNKRVLPMGYCGIINHSYNSNANVTINNKLMIIQALKI